MCGICGQFNFRDHSPVSRGDIEAMTKSLVHRGPDDEGYHYSGPLGFGFRRLSIIDLEGGRQPMSDSERSVWVVFNGEIYNFRELREQLESLGHVFQTRSDTEVIVHGYKQWGEGVFQHLNGMFGLAIWDERIRKLIIARDPMGIKLVYYKVADGTVWFASEIKAILARESAKPEIDPLSLNLMLRYRYTPSPQTLYKGIFKLAPGTMIVFENGEHRIARWYKYKPVPFNGSKSDREAKEELLEIYKRSIKRHLISDVPIGLLLSGGIDSGLLLGLMNLYGDSWRTYTIGYGKSFHDDELVDADKTAGVLGANHLSIQIDRETFEKRLPEVVGFLEEPVATSSIVPMYFVCERARQDVKVALVGQGPDELFGGYVRHLGVRYGENWRDVPAWIRIPLSSVLSSFPRNEAVKRGIHSLNIPDRMRRYQHVFSVQPRDSIDGLFRNGLLPAEAGERVLDYWSDLEPLMANLDELGGFQFLEIRSSLPDELLMYADKLSMAHGLEVRVPYLDREVVEYVEKLPAKFKVRHGTRKWLHRQVCKDFLPREILKRRKRGFATNVVDDWFRSMKSEKMKDYLLNGDSMIFGYLQYGAVKKLLDEHMSGQNDNHKILFSIVVIEEWLRGRAAFSSPKHQGINSSGTIMDRIG